MLTHKPTKLVK